MSNVWDERYAGDEYFYGTEPNAFLVSQQHLLESGMHCLAVADGEVFADMEILHLCEHDDIIREGAGHNGMSALIDLVARRI